MNIEEMRQYIRHPTKIPIQCTTPHGRLNDNPVMRNVSKSGMCFTTGTKIEANSNIELTIPFLGTEIEIAGTIMWCHDMDDFYELGVRFDDGISDLAKVLMDRLCNVEQYRQQVKERERRELTSTEAGREWMEKFGDKTWQ